jgi:hypothetical protein
MNKEIVEKRGEATEPRKARTGLSTQLTTFQQALAGKQTPATS